jgi:glucosamine--fructose-6-phosphate aminotransferase (isomerizing)
MCGIFGYVGEPIDAGAAVLDALKTLEYRGYDSWGVAVVDGDRIAIEKAPGRIGNSAVQMPTSAIGFGHTRWATHGGVSAANAHPHLDCRGEIAVIHNGIIENFRELKALLVASGHRFASETDSEVIAHLLEEELPNVKGDLTRAMRTVVDRLQGFNAVIAMDAASRQLVASKNVSPLVIGEGPRGCVIASDASALRGYALKIRYVEDGQLVRLTHDGCAIIDRHCNSPRLPDFLPFELDEQDIGLNGYPHFMAKEMAEQPAVLERFASEGEGAIRQLADAIVESYGAFLIGCGTAAYAALTGSYLFSRICRRHINFVAGSEFKYHEHFLTAQSLVVALSQSGETADIIEAMMSARRAGARLGALVNVPHSTLDRMVDIRVPLSAGPEQCVLSTKAYTAMVAVLLLAAYAIRDDYDTGRQAVAKAAGGLREMLKPQWQQRVIDAARQIAPSEHLYVIGRGLAYPTALEAALKIKEVSYIHAEGFAGGELKHGVIALIAPGTPCVVYAPCDETRSDILSGAMELKSRGGFIIGIGPGNEPVFDIHLPTPDVGNASPLVNALPAQMLGYHAALLRGNDPDKPRNLAKSVTVK